MPCTAQSLFLWHASGSEPDGRSLDIWMEFTGQSEEAARNWGWLNVFHPEDREKERVAWKNALQMKRMFSSVCRLRDRKGEYQRYRTLIVPLFNETHQIQRWLIISAIEANLQPVSDENWESRLMYQMIFRQTAVGVLCLTLDGVILRTNERFCQFTGYSEKELLSFSLWQLATPEGIMLHLQVMRDSLIHNQNVPTFRVSYIRRDGTLVWGNLTHFLVRQPDNEPRYFFFLVEDATAQVQAEAERARLLEHAREAHLEALVRTRQLETVFEAMTDGVLISDKDKHIMESNSALNRLLHLESNPGRIQRIAQPHTLWLKAFNKQGRMLEPHEWPLELLLRGEDLQTSDVLETSLLLPDGTEIYVEHSGSAMHDQDGQIIGAVLVIRDVTERHRMEQHVRKSFDALLALAEALVQFPEYDKVEASAEQTQTARSQVPFHAVQAVGDYLVQLTCQILEYPSSSIVLIDPQTEKLRPIATTGLPPEELEDYYDMLANTTFPDYLDPASVAALRANQVIFYTIVSRRLHHTPHNLLLAPMMIGDCLLGFLGVDKGAGPEDYSDEEISLVNAIAKLILLVLERERLQQEWLEAHSSELALMEANRRFDEFLSIASHELRTPLAGVKGNIQLALRRLATLKAPELPELHVLLEKLEKIQEYLHHAEHRVNVQNRMIGDLLDVSRIQANKLELVMGRCNLLTVVRDAVEDQQYNVPNRQINLTLPAYEKVMVIGDADRLGQVIHNYLTNALKYAPKDRPIWVELAEVNCLARVSVRDEGPGLSPEEQKHVWERFYRVKNIVAQGAGGPSLGLGLHICRTIIEAHQGRLGLESARERGSTFWFALPLAQPTTSIPEGSSGITYKQATSI